jgi:hypothetical protein
MATSLEIFSSAASTYLGKAAVTIAFAEDAIQKVNAINSSAPDAKSTFDSAKTNELASASSDAFNFFNNSIVPSYKAAVRENKAEAEKILAEILNKTEESQRVSKEFDSTVNKKEQEINAAKITNPSSTDAVAEEKQRNATIVGDTTAPIGAAALVATSVATGLAGKQIAKLGKRIVAGVPDGAMPAAPQPVQATIKNSNGNNVSKDHRVKIRVPPGYFSQYTSGLNKELEKLGAILFPYTPTINYETKADYVNLNPTHSNFSIYFYKNSSVGSISITGKFTVQNEAEAGIYLATLHLLRALTKMKSGGSTGDVDSGAPPPICRLVAYGDFMMNNVPIVINSFRVDLPDNVDYFRLGKTSGSLANNIYGMASVPIISNITISCLPIYSRDEMQKFSVGNLQKGWIGDSASRKAGYL